MEGTGHLTVTVNLTDHRCIRFDDPDRKVFNEIRAILDGETETMPEVGMDTLANGLVDAIYGCITEGQRVYAIREHLRGVFGR